MAHVKEGSHSFTCHPHVYPQAEWAIPAFTPQLQSITALCPVLISHPAEGRRLSWPSGWLHTKMLYPHTVIHLSTEQAQCRITSLTWTMAKPCMEQSSNQCHYSNFSGFLQKTTKNVSFHKVRILVCVPCPRSTFAHATLICTFLTNYVHTTPSLVPKWYDTWLGREGLQSSPVRSLTPSHRVVPDGTEI